MNSIPRFIATLLLISYLRAPNSSNEGQTKTQFAFQELKKDSAHAPNLLNEIVVPHDEKKVRSIIRDTEHEAPGDAVLHERNTRQTGLKEVGEDVELSVNDHRRRRRSGENEIGNFTATYKRDAKRKFPLRSVDLKIASLTSSVEKYAGASSCYASRSLSLTQNHLKMKTISNQPSEKRLPVSSRNNEAHVTRPMLDKTPVQVCAEAWRSGTRPTQRRQHSHCFMARREHGLGHTLSCSLMGKLTGAACDEPKRNGKQELRITGRWKLQGVNLKLLNSPISDASIAKLTLSTWKAVTKSNSHHPSSSDSTMASNSSMRRHYLLLQANVSLVVREFNLAGSTPVNSLLFDEDSEMEISHRPTAREKEKLEKYAATSRHLCSSPVRVIDSHADDVSSEGDEERVERRRRSIESLKTAQFGEHIRNLVEPAQPELGDEDPSRFGMPMPEWAPWLAAVATMFVLVFMISLRKATRRLSFDISRGSPAVQMPSQSAPVQKPQVTRSNENSPDGVKASQNLQASHEKGIDSSRRTASKEADTRQLAQNPPNILPASGMDCRKQSVPDKARFDGVRKNCGVGQKLSKVPIKPANSSLRPQSCPHEEMEVEQSLPWTGGRSSQHPGVSNPPKMSSVPRVEPMDTEESQFTPDNVRSGTTNERRLQAPTRIKMEPNGTHFEEMDIEESVPEANTGAKRQGFVTPAEQKNTKTRQFRQSRYKCRQPSKRS